MYVHVHLHASHDSQSQGSHQHGRDTNQLSLSLTTTCTCTNRDSLHMRDLRGQFKSGKKRRTCVITGQSPVMVAQDNVHCMLNWISACVGKALIKGNYLLHQRQASVYSDVFR